MIEALRATLAADGNVMFSVRVHPHARATKITSVMDDGSVKISIIAPADEGKANTELVKFLAEEFQVPVACVSLLSGQGGRRKIVRINQHLPRS